MTAYRINMKKNENPQRIEYRVPLKTDNMSDILTEKFDNLMAFMPENSYLFSGAIATYFANQDLARYVCMIIDKNNYETVRRNMSRSIYWLECSVCNIENVFDTGIVCNNIMMNAKAIFTDKVTEMAKSVSVDNNPYRSVKDKWGSDPFGTYITMTSSNRNAFINTQGAIVILICGDIDTIRNSGISINGVVVDHEGQVYEVIRGAKEACERRILRKSKINRHTDGMFIKNINNSFVNSGWKSTVNVDGLCNAIEVMNKPRKMMDKPRSTRKKTNDHSCKHSKKYAEYLDALYIESLGIVVNVNDMNTVSVQTTAGLRNLFLNADSLYRPHLRNIFIKCVTSSVCNVFKIKRKDTIDVSFIDNYRIVIVNSTTNDLSLTIPKIHEASYADSIKTSIRNELMRNKIVAKAEVDNKKEKQSTHKSYNEWKVASKYAYSHPISTKRFKGKSKTLERTFSNGSVKVNKIGKVSTQIIIGRKPSLNYADLDNRNIVNGVRDVLLRSIKALSPNGLGERDEIDRTFSFTEMYNSTVKNGVSIQFSFRSGSNQLTDNMLNQRSINFITSNIDAFLSINLSKINRGKRTAKKSAQIKREIESKYTEATLSKDFFKILKVSDVEESTTEDMPSYYKEEPLNHSVDINGIEHDTAQKMSYEGAVFGKQVEPSQPIEPLTDDTELATAIPSAQTMKFGNWTEIDGGIVGNTSFLASVSNDVVSPENARNAIIRTRFVIRTHDPNFNRMNDHVRDKIMRDITFSVLRKYIYEVCGKKHGESIINNMTVGIYHEGIDVILIETDINGNRLTDIAYDFAMGLNFTSQANLIETAIDGLMFSIKNEQLKKKIAAGKFGNKKTTGADNGSVKQFESFIHSNDAYIKQWKKGSHENERGNEDDNDM